MAPCNFQALEKRLGETRLPLAPTGLSIPPSYTGGAARHAVLLCGAGHRREALPPYPGQLPAAVWQVRASLSAPFHFPFSSLSSPRPLPPFPLPPSPFPPFSLQSSAQGAVPGADAVCPAGRCWPAVPCWRSLSAPTGAAARRPGPRRRRRPAPSVATSSPSTSPCGTDVGAAGGREAR